MRCFAIGSWNCEKAAAAMMDPLFTGFSVFLAASEGIAQSVLALALVASTGLALGSLRYRGVGLGTAGVLFAGILFGHFGWRLEPALLEFLREFGLILFVFCIGLQLGPGFFASLRKEGMKLNLLATAIVVLGAGTTLLTGWLLRIAPAASLGLFSGATTNTPSLGAAQGTIQTLEIGRDSAVTALPALAYAVAYPVGIIGIIAALLILRAVFKVDAEAEATAAEAAQRQAVAPVQRMCLIVENPNLDGLAVKELPGRVEAQVAISRIRPRDCREVFAATPESPVHVGDSLLAVGTSGGLESFRRIVGRLGEDDLMSAPSDAIFRRVVVTKSEVLGKSVEELGLEHLHGVIPTRLIRGETEMPAISGLRLQFGDTLQLVGTADHVAAAAKMLGNSIKELNQTHFVPIFVGIALGVLVGSGPLAIPGLPVPLKLGLAGGPLILAIILGRIGHFGRLVWHMPLNANLAFRELGMILFLACVGLKAGPQFFATVFTSTGLLWMGAAIVITLVPLLLVGVIARKAMGMNFTTMSGLLAGSMTDPPALAFANGVCKSDAPAISYATVYPLTMLLRILVAQLLVLLLWP
jgi:putative transport protein